MSYAITTIGDVAVETFGVEGKRDAAGTIVFGYVRFHGGVTPLALTNLAQAMALCTWIEKVRECLAQASRVLVTLEGHAMPTTPDEVTLRAMLVGLDVHEPY